MANHIPQNSPGDLLDHGDSLLDPPDPSHPGEAVEVVLQCLDLLVQLQLGDDVTQLSLRTPREVTGNTALALSPSYSVFDHIWTQEWAYYGVLLGPLGPKSPF